jgi:hypothetical protein
MDGTWNYEGKAEQKSFERAPPSSSSQKKGLNVQFYPLSEYCLPFCEKIFSFILLMYLEIDGFLRSAVKPEKSNRAAGFPAALLR